MQHTYAVCCRFFNYIISKLQRRPAAALIQLPFNHNPPALVQLTSESLSLFQMHVFISSPHVYITYITHPVGVGKVWHQLRYAPPLSLQQIHSLLQEHIPPSSWRKDTHLPCSQIPAMFYGNVAFSFSEPPLRRPQPSPTGAKISTNY